MRCENEAEIETKQALTTVHIVNCEILSLFTYTRLQKTATKTEYNKYTRLQQQLSSQLVYFDVKFFDSQ